MRKYNDFPVMGSQIATLDAMGPCDIEAEEGAIGCLLSNPRCMSKVVDILTSEDFYRDAHSIIFGAAVKLYRQGKQCNTLNVVYEMKRTGEIDHIKDGESLITKLADHMSLAMTSDIIDYADKIKSDAINRRIANVAYEIFQMAKRNEDNVLERAEKMIYEIALGVSTDSVADMDETMSSFLEQLEQRRQNFRNDIANGVPTRFKELDQMIGGLQPSELLILAARPSVGKTALALNIALNIVQHSKHVLFFSMEMKKEALAQRLIAMEVPMDQAMLRDGDVSDPEMEQVKGVADVLRHVDLKVDDRTRTLAEIKSKTRRVHGIKPLDCIVVDYLQLIKSINDGGKRQTTRAEEVAEMSRGLKELAMELNIPVLALAQLKRDVEGRASKVPMLSDLKESGAIEQDADVVMFLHCTEEELEKRIRCEPYKVDVVVGKQRNGRVGQISLMFKPRSTKFEDDEIKYGEDES